MPRGIPNARPSAGAAQSREHSDHSLWDSFAAAAITGVLQRGNQDSRESANAAANIADRMMDEREKRFGKPVAAPAEAEVVED